MLRVVRVGGSLLTWDELPATLADWLARHSSTCNVFVAGGGPWVEALRIAADRFSLDEQESHWLSIRAMDLTANLLRLLLPSGVRCLEEFAELQSEIGAHGHAQIIFNVRLFLRNVEPRQPGVRLKPNWDVTSDSIAARLAYVLQADELVLLKSAGPPMDANLQQLSKCGYVDTYFPVVANGLSVRFQNLRDYDNGTPGHTPIQNAEKRPD